MAFITIRGLMLALSVGLARGQTPTVLTISQQNVNRNRYALNAWQTAGSTNCGPGAIVDAGWQIRLEMWLSFEPDVGPPPAPIQFDTQVNTLGGYFNTGTGTFSAPVDGVYYISGYARCETSACDITLRLNSATRVCGWGTDMVQNINDDNDFSGNWYSTGCATVERLTLNQQVSMWHESGQSNDCIYDTSFHYNHLNVLLYMADGEVAAFVPGTQG